MNYDRLKETYGRYAFTMLIQPAHNNGPIFNPLAPLELCQSPLLFNAIMSMQLMQNRTVFVCNFPNNSLISNLIALSALSLNAIMLMPLMQIKLERDF